jgi:hypothetical protein
MRINKLARQQTHQLAEAQEEEHRSTQKAQRDLETMLETRKQTTISLLGVIFLPGAFFAVSYQLKLLPWKSPTDIYPGTVQHNVLRFPGR